MIDNQQTLTDMKRIKETYWSVKKNGVEIFQVDRTYTKESVWKIIRAEEPNANNDITRYSFREESRIVIK